MALAGCAARTPSNPAPTEPVKGATLPYVMKVGDMLDIRFYKTPELNTKVPIRSDGKISLELVGDTQAAGLQPEELSRILTEHYSKELSNPRVTVIVRSFGGNIFVTGEVRNPSAVKYADGMTALQALAGAGGFLETASLGNVVLIRETAGKYQGHRLTLDRALTGDDLASDVPLQPSDILFVPKTRVANLDLFVDQYIRKALPVQPFIPAF